MVLTPGEKLHIIVRRNFETDLRRHFVGVVTACNEAVARVEGYAFLLDMTSNQYVRRPELRTRLIGLAHSGYIINILPDDVDLDSMRYVQNAQGRLVVTDGRAFSLDINEFGVQR